MQDLAFASKERPGCPRAYLHSSRLPLALLLVLIPSVAAAQADVPTAPGKPSATAGNQTVSLTWTKEKALAEGVERYQYVAIGNLGDPANWVAVPGSGQNTTSYTVTGLTNGTSYRFRVRALNSLGAGAGSDNSDAVVPAGPPPAPSKPSATAGTESATVSWSSNGNGGSALAYWQYAKKAGSNGTYGSWTQTADASVTVTGLTAGVPYQFKVRGVNKVGEGAESPESDAVTPVAPVSPPSQAPAAPSKPAVTAGNRSVSLSWSSNGSGSEEITHWEYRQYRRNQHGDWLLGNWTQVPGSGPSTTSYTVTGLTNGAAYKFRVRAVSSAGHGESPESDVVTPADPSTAPLAPGRPSATAGDESATLSWSSGGDGGSAIVRWEYQKNEDGGSYGSWVRIPGSGPSTTSYTVTGLTNGTEYRFKVRAVNGVGDGAASSASAAVTPAAPATAPPAPGQPTATAGDASATLSWSSGGDGGSAIVRWEYQKNEDGGSYGSWVRTPGSGPSTTSYTVTGLTNGTAYRFKVRAVNGVGDGAASAASAAVTPEEPPSPPAKPASPRVTGEDEYLYIEWTAPADNGEPITGYDLGYRARSGASWGEWQQTSTGDTGTWERIRNLTNGTRYQVRVRAVNAHVQGPWSDSAEGTPSGPPAAPAAPTVTAGSPAGTLNVTWTAPSNGGSPITGYSVYAKQCHGCASSAFTGLPASSTSKSIKLSAGTSYLVAVQASNKNGQSSSSWTWGRTADAPAEEGNDGSGTPTDDGNDGGAPTGDGNDGTGGVTGGDGTGGNPGGDGNDGGDDGGDENDDDGDGDGGGGGGGTASGPTPRWVGDMAVEAVGRQTLYVFWRGEWAEKTLTTLTIEARTREHGWRPVGTALSTDGQIRIGGMRADSPYTFRFRERMADGSFRYSDYAHGTTGSYRGPCRTTGNAGDGAVERFLCLRDGRFEARVHWANPDLPGHYGNGGAVPLAMSDESGLFWFFDPANIELAVKVLDGRALNNAHWVFYGALSDVEYWVTVRDTSDGLKRTYYNPPKEMCGRGDVNAFEENGDVTEAAGAASAGAAPWFLGVDLVRRSAAPLPAEAGVPVEAPANPAEASPGVAGIDLLALESAPLPAGIEASQSAGACAPSASRLCLLDGRFSVDVDFVDPNVDDPASATKSGQVLPSLTTGQTGFFWFFDPRNIELAVKTLDGRAQNGRFWLLYGGLSDVEYSLTVTDTVTGASRNYVNESGSLCGRADTNAF